MLFFLSGIISALLAFFYPANTIVIHIHDTYIVIDNQHLFIFLAIVFLFYWIVYVLCQQILLSKVIIWMHFIMMLISILAILFANKTMQPVKTSWEYIDLSRDNMTASIIIIGLLFSVMLFVINIIGGAIRKMF